MEDIDKRRQQLKEKFRKLYSKEDYENPKIFNLVIDTTASGKDETLRRVHQMLEKGY